MKGWKTKAGGVGAILGGVALIIKAVIDGDWSQITTAWAGIVGGLTALGIGHKVDKIND